MCETGQKKRNVDLIHILQHIGLVSVVYLIPIEVYTKSQIRVMCTYFKLNMSVINHQTSKETLISHGFCTWKNRF